MLRPAFLCLTTLLAGCGPQFIAESLYPGGKVFAFRSAHDVSVMQYACAAEGPGGKTVQDRAAASHRYFDVGLENLARKSADGVFANIEAGVSDIEIANRVMRDAEAFSAKAGAEMEARYACTYIGDQ